MAVRTMNHRKIVPVGAIQRAVTEGADAVLWLAPTERDTWALRSAGVHAFSPIGPFSPAHAERLRGFEGLLLIGVSLDDAGAFEARRRWQLVMAVLSARQVQFRAPAAELGEGATLADHLDAYNSWASTRRVSLRDMRTAIDREEDRRRVQKVPNAPLATFARGRSVRTGVAS